MKWFSGGVAAAVASCRQENALFIVFAHGTDLENLKVSIWVDILCYPVCR